MGNKSFREPCVETFEVPPLLKLLAFGIILSWLRLGNLSWRPPGSLWESDCIENILPSAGTNSLESTLLESSMWSGGLISGKDATR
jgi:hypothetical protein